MKKSFSNSEMELFEKQDYEILNHALTNALNNHQTSFKFHISTFQDVPGYKDRLSKFCLNNGITYDSDGSYFIFHIS